MIVRLTTSVVEEIRDRVIISLHVRRSCKEVRVELHWNKGLIGHY